MVLELNRGEVEVGAKTEPRSEPKTVMELNPGEEVVGDVAKPWFKQKKGGVIPAKRRLVKRIMFDYLVQSFASFCCSCWPPPSFGVPLSTKGINCFKMDPTPPRKSIAKKKKKGIFPAP
ncbi:hypothetical protein L1049_026620 [Liquidambar formosana]|uniref:Uncharacterized protein n=1 Tax=Liquidambar formosana TaxID=63359 RepID=A0AAP0NF46_LIQFO